MSRLYEGIDYLSRFGMLLDKLELIRPYEGPGAIIKFCEKYNKGVHNER